jgi:hypothetical protein
MTDFRNMFPTAKVESADFSPAIMNGALTAFTLLPGGSMFTDKHALLAPEDSPPVAKRGNIVFVRNNTVYIVSTELAERVIERTTYKKTPLEEDTILRRRLVDILKTMEFTRPAVKS